MMIQTMQNNAMKNSVQLMILFTILWIIDYFPLFNVKFIRNAKKKVTITNIIYCDRDEYVSLNFHEPKIKKKSVFITKFFDSDHLEILDSIEIQDYLFNIMPSNVIYEFQFKQGNKDFCLLNTKTYFVAVKLMQKIYSVQQVDIKFVGFQKQTRIRIIDKLKIYNFTNIIFENFELQFSVLTSSQAIIEFNNLNYNAFLTIKNCVFTTTENKNQFSVSFYSSHSYSALIEDVLIKNLNLSKSKLFIFHSLNQQKKGTIIIRNLKILDCDFFQTSLIIFNTFSNNYDNKFDAENVQISNCQFRESFILQSSSIQNFNVGNIMINNINIENSIFQNSSFIFVDNAKKISIEQLQVNDLTISQGSYFYYVNTITLVNSKFDKVQLHNNSKLIINQIDLELNLEGQQHTSILNLQITNTGYDSIQSIISIKQQKQLEFKNIQFYNNYLISELNFNEISFVQSTIYIECDFCILENIDVIRLHGLPDISIMQSEDVIMKNIKLTQNSDFHPQMLHSDYNCLKKLQNFYMSFFIFFGKYKNISIQNIQISETFTFNAPFLIFQGYDLLEKVQNESISIFDSKFEKNLLLIYREFSSSSIFYFDSNQHSLIEIINTAFLKNHLNEYYQNEEIISATTLVALQRSGSVNIKNCSFVKNILTNSSDSILYVKTQQAQIENTIFYQNNLLEFQDMNQNFLFQITNKETIFLDDLEKIFPVKSDSGNGVFNVNNIIVYNLTINQSFAYSGGGLRIILRGYSFILIENSQYYQIRTTLDIAIYSYGGCLYIDAQASMSLAVNISNTEFDTSYSRTEGGGIYVIPSNKQNQVHFKNLIVKNCFATKNSFLSFELQKLNQIISSILFENCQFSQDELSFNEFLKNLDDFTSFEVESILLGNPLIYSKYGNISLKNCSFVNTYQQFLVNIEEADNIILKDIRFIKSSIKKSPFVRLTLRQQKQGMIIIQNVEFLQNFQIESLTKIKCQTIQFSFQQSELQCPKKLFSFTKDQFHRKDNNNKLENQLQCNLKLLNNNTEYQYSFLEIISVENIHFIQILGLKFENNQCQGCYQGVLKISKLETEIQELLKIKNLDVQNNICGYSGCFSFLGKQIDNPYRSDLVQNRILQYKNIKILTERIRYDILLENSLFLNNTADFGGALMIVQAQSLIYNCEFKFNTAKIGGAIYFFANSKLLILIQSIIIYNTAVADLSENNSTRYGSDLVESPRSLSLIVNKDQTQLEKKVIEESNSKIVEIIIVQPYYTLGYKKKLQFLTLPSGRPIGSYQYFDSYSQSLIPYNLTFRIIPLNTFNKQIKGLDGHTCQITPVAINSSSNANVSDKFYSLSYQSFKFNKETQDFNLDDLVIYFNPNYDENLSLRLIIECDFIQIPIYDEQPPYLIIENVKNYQLQVDIKTFKCQIGEYLNINSGGCGVCDSSQNQYLVSYNAQFCSFKDDTKMKSIESSKIELRSHYWRPYYYSSTIEHCHHLEENCQGGWISGDDSCIYGHIGALCEQCDLYNSRGNGSFSVSSIYSCGNCGQIVANVISIILISFWTLISTLVSVTSTVQMIEEFVIGLKLKQVKMIITIQTASTAILLKILTNYLQIISSISTFQLQIPIGVQTVFNSVSNPIEQMAYSLDCFLIKISDIDIIYIRIIWSVLMAIFYIVIFLLLGLIGKLINQIKFSISHISTAMLYIYIFMSPSLIQGLISLLSYRVISNEYWVQGNVAYRYDTDQHIKWSIGFSLPQLVFFGFFLPFLFWLGLNKNRNNLDKIVVRKIWGYLYNEYKQKSYYWETIKILQKELIIIVLIYYDDYIPIKASLVFLILFAYSYSTQQSKPYTTGELNHLDSQSTIVCAVSIILGSSIFSAQKNTLYEIVWPFYIIIILLNLLFISKMIVKVCFAYFKKLSETIDKVKGFIKKRFSFVLTLHPSLHKVLEPNSKKQARIKQKYKKIREKLMPQIRKLLMFKRNNLINFTDLDESNKDSKLNSCEDFQIQSLFRPQCQTYVEDQSDINSKPKNMKSQNLPSNSIQKALDSQQQQFI